MRKVLVILLVGLVVFAGVASAEELKFRGVEFGSTIDQVKQAEDTSLIDSSSDALVYKDTLASKEFIILYEFQNDSFESAMYYFAQDYVSNPNTYTDTYYNIKSILKDKYGAPDTTSETWISNPTFTDDMGWAVKTGEVGLADGWEFDNGSIKMTLGNISGEVLFGIIYESDSVKDESTSTESKL